MRMLANRISCAHMMGAPAGTFSHTIHALNLACVFVVACSPLESRGSLFGVVRNPYNTARTTAGSSGGSAAAVATSFGMVGLGTDTGAHSGTPRKVLRVRCEAVHYCAGPNEQGRQCTHTAY